MKNLLIILIVLFTFIGCKTAIHKPADGKTNPLVLRDGLLYADSTSKTPFTGRNKSKARNQFVEYDVVNGIKEGDFIIYYPNQKIQMIGQISNNKNVGEWKYYNLGGTLETVGHFENDKPSGIWTWYYPDGKIAEEGNYKLGKRDGKWKTFNSEGDQVIIRVYKNEKLVDSTIVKELDNSSK